MELISLTRWVFSVMSFLSHSVGKYLVVYSIPGNNGVGVYCHPGEVKVLDNN